MKIICPGCGANVTFLPNKQKCYCEYCGIEINNSTAKKFDGMINFEVSERDAIAKFQKKLKIKNDNMKNNKILSVSKVFIPYFLFDYSLNILHSGRYYARAAGFIDYLRCYSGNIMQLQSNISPNENIGNFDISQYDFSKIKVFEKNNIKNEYIAKSAEIYEIFNDKSKENLLNAVNRAIRGREKEKGDSEGYELRIKKFRHREILLPVYFLKVQKNNLIYNYLMNGQTGKVIEGNKRKNTANFKLFVPFFIWIILLSLAFGLSIFFYKNVIANVICIITSILCFLSFTLIGSIMRKNYLKNVNLDFLEYIQVSNFKKEFYKSTAWFRKKIKKIYGKKIFLEDKLIYIQPQKSNY